MAGAWVPVLSLPAPLLGSLGGPRCSLSLPCCQVHIPSTCTDLFANRVPIPPRKIEHFPGWDQPADRNDRIPGDCHICTGLTWGQRFEVSEPQFSHVWIEWEWTLSFCLIQVPSALPSPSGGTEGGREEGGERGLDGRVGPTLRARSWVSSSADPGFQSPCSTPGLPQDPNNPGVDRHEDTVSPESQSRKA